MSETIMGQKKVEFDVGNLIETSEDLNLKLA